MIARSYLYVPGDRPQRFSRALASGCDAVVFDLEDSVPLGSKDEALQSVTTFLCRGNAPPKPEIRARVNTGSRALVDLEGLVSVQGITGVVVPKSTIESLDQVFDVAGGFRVTALVEKAVGVLQLTEIANLSGVVRLALGEIDLAADLGVILSSDGRELDLLRINVVVASAAAGLAPPIGPVWIDIPDIDGLATSTRHLRRIGFGGRQAIHPTQIETINSALSPSQAELEQAAHVLDLAEKAGGSACVDEQGHMIDEAVLRSARRLLE